MNAIDTIYEFAGAELSGHVLDVLWGTGLPLILALAGVAAVVHALASDRASIRDLAVYVLFLIFLSWLLSPVEKKGTRMPRFISWLGAATDAVQSRLIRRIHGRFLEEPFEFERIAALSSFGRVHDRRLAGEMRRFLGACARPALARVAPESANLFRAGALEYSPRCEKKRQEIWSRLRQHLETHPLHRSLLDAVRKRGPAEATEFRRRYMDQLAIRATDEPGSPSSESDLVLASLGEYSYIDPSQSVGHTPFWAKALIGPAWLPFEYKDAAYNLVLGGLAALNQDWENRWSAKQKYYLAGVYGPHIYGLALLLLMGLFPVVGMFALLPRKWKVLVTFSEAFVSVKLWPVCWAILTSFNGKRSVLEALAPAQRADGDVWLAVAAFYLLTPGVAFLIVHLATAAAAMPFTQAVSPPAGPGLGPAGPVVNVVARVAR